MEKNIPPTDPPQNPPPVDPATLQERLDDFEVQLIEREYRLVPVVREFLNYALLRKGKPKTEPEKGKWIAKRNAAVRALVFSRFRGGGAVGSGLFMLILTGVGVYLTFVATRIARDANQLLNIQVSVEEATRQATISSELTALLDQINEHQLQLGDSVPLNSSLRGRIIAASKMMQPYKLPLPRVDSLSPERGRLLLALLEMQRTGTASLISQCDFSYTYCNGLVFRMGIDLQGGTFTGSKMRNTIWTNCDFINCVFLDTDMTGATFKNCTFVLSDFRGAKFVRTSFESCEFSGCDVRGGKILSPKVFGTNSIELCDFAGASTDIPVKDLLYGDSTFFYMDSLRLIHSKFTFPMKTLSM